jgi:tRNA (guanine-N7-)-methyltransferase
MAKQKLKRMRTLDGFANVIQNPLQWQGIWHEYFGNNNPMTVELGCGKAEISVALAEKYPERNFIGIDIKGARLWVGARDALDKNLKNICFMRLWAERLPLVFVKSEISEIWITFPDPFRKRAQAKKRLTSTRFLSTYRSVLASCGSIHMKTDDNDLFQFTLKTLEKEKCLIHRQCDDLYHAQNMEDVVLIQSHYEKQHLKMGRSIKYVRFSLPAK